VSLDHAVFSYAQWIESKMKNATTLIADNWEHLVNSALVLRYHLLSKQIETKTGTRPVGLPLSTVYECDEKTYPGNVLANFDVCLEKAVYGEHEVFVSSSLASGLYSNKKLTVSAHHDAVISCVKPPVSLTVGLNLPRKLWNFFLNSKHRFHKRQTLQIVFFCTFVLQR